jgi:protein ImuB
MAKRFVSIWFRHLTTDWFTLREPHLKNLPFVLRSSSHGRMIIVAVNEAAERKGIFKGSVLADARAIVQDLEVLDDTPDLPEKLLKRIGEWCIRFTPVVAIDLPDGLFFDASGCSHLWGGDNAYIDDIRKKLNARGYNVRVAIADTPGVAWAVARYGTNQLVIEPGQHIEALLALPPQALRLERDVVDRLNKLGLHQIRQFIRLPRPSLRKRFGQQIINQLDKALGQQMEILEPIVPVQLYQERLPCMEPIVTQTGIEIALKELLESLCLRLQQDQKGLRCATFKAYRVDGKIEKIEISTSRPSHHITHLLKLFEIKISTIEPAMGIELFVLEGPKVEDFLSTQETMWKEARGLEDVRLAELIDRIAMKIGEHSIRRYVAAEHYWPERSFKPASSLQDKSLTGWRGAKLRPLHVLTNPEKIEVTAPIPDYPPMLFRYKGQIHQIVNADGPERIEQEWWLQQGQHRDYYRVEDEQGHRFWIFRLGHYHDKTFQWFLHGFFP